MYFIIYKYNTCIKFALSFMVLSIIMAHVLLLDFFFFFFFSSSFSEG